MSVEALAGSPGSTLADRLDTVVRPEFRVAVLVPPVGDPILGSPACAVPECVHSSTLRRAVSGAPGPLETGRSPGPARVGGDRGSRGDGSSTASTLPGG